MIVFPQSAFRSAFTRVVLPALLAMSASTAFAVKADRDQPLSFAADSARVDEAQKLNILSGNVEISKGTMVVKADRVEIRQNADGTQSASAFGGTGGKAYFSQKRDGVNESIEGEAERVDYDGKADTVRFSGKAVMRRLKDTRTSDEVSGQTIVYDNRTSVFQVLGSNTPGVSSGRVRGVITPRSATEGTRP